MFIKKTINLVETVIDEVALEGLDGITLEALWQRLAVRFSYSLPLKNSFMEQIWKICVETYDFSFYELGCPRENLVIYDPYELEYLNLDLDKDFEQKDIYLYCPVEDGKLGIRGSCSTYFTRKNISYIVKNLTFFEADKYGKKLVIVASQRLRERALIEENICSTLQLPLLHYCLLERIGRSRSIGEITIKKSNIKEDAKALFYIRKGLQEHGLIRKQVYYQGNSGINYNGQNTGTLVHLTRFFNTRKPKVIMWAEHLINYLKSKENYAAEYIEVKNELDLDYSIKKFFKIHLLQKIFRTDLKVPYRTYYPNSVEKEWQVKNNSSKERIIKLVTLSDPNIEISDLWRTEEVKEDGNLFQLDLSNQKLHIPFLTQIYKIVESKEYKGASQTELATKLGFTKLISRTLVRNLVKAKVVSTYLDDIGRQRTTKFVSKKFDAKSSVKKQFELEISKIKEYSRSMKSENIEEKSSNILDKKHIPSINLDEIKVTESINNTNNLLKNDVSNDNIKIKILTKANHILWKYKLFKNQNKYRYTSSEKYNVRKNINNSKTDLYDKPLNIKDILNNSEVLEDNTSANIVDSDFYKTIETKLIVQKPECKKKSRKIAVVGFMKNVQNSDDNKQLSISYRLLRRANLIIESIKEHKIIEDTQKLMKYINAEEDKEGLTVKIDKNSLIRLLQKLAEDNFIKCIKLILKNNKQTKQKVVNFICDPSIDVNDTVIQSAVEQAKLKFCMTETDTRRSLENIEKICSLHTTNISNRKKPIEEKTVLYKNNMLGKKYGYSPKFIRMKTMHIFLYYLIYDYPKICVSKSIFLDNVKKQGFYSEDFLHSNLNIYSDNINWKMFIPSLPKHRGYPLGWALMCDILLRMPLSIFVKVYNVNFDVPGLQELLDHPIKKHFLIKDLSTPIRNMLFVKRKYMFSIHEIVTRLCYLGLVQFGPQMLKEKDQVFIYLNRHTELLDTTSSAAGYHRIEDKTYPVTRFLFSSLSVVENYWYEMWNTCINTCLGGRSVVEGKDILLEDLSRKVEMIQALKVKQPEEAEKYDTGFVPGDRKGAAGIDSAFFPHLKRNWNWVNTGQKNAEKDIKSNSNVETTKLGTKFTNTQIQKVPQQKKRCSSIKQNQVKLSINNTINNGNNKSKVEYNKEQIGLEFPVVVCSKPPKIIRKVLPRKSMLRKRVKYDEIDFSALQRMDKLRVDWEQHEDNILLVCKVAMVYLCPNPRRNLVTFTAIRDILRSYSFTSYNKTSRACQRRLLYMLKQSKTVNSVLLGVEEVKQDFFVNKRFGGLVDSIKSECENPIEYEKRVEKIFKDLVTYIAKKYYNISNMEQREPIMLPKTIQEFNIFYKLKLPTRTITTPGISKEVHEINDIHITTINSVIHSSMCCGKERRSWAYQLFKVYQQYPEYLLRSAMLKIRADQMVTMKKNYMCAYKKFGNCMPMSSSQYQLSSAYYYKFQTKWPYEVFSESYGILLSLMENYVKKKNKATDGVEVKPGIGGIVAAIHDFVGTDNMDIDIEIPDQIIMLDPALPEKDEVYQRIAFRYQTILESLSTNYAEHLKNSTNNNFPSNRINRQNHSHDTKQLNMSNIQHSLVEVCSSKRKVEHEPCFTQIKKQKLNHKKNLHVSKKNTHIKNLKIENLNKEIPFVIENIDTKSQFIEGSNKSEIFSLVKCNNFSIKPSSCELTNNDLYSEQNKITANNTDTQAFSECYNEDNVYVANNSNKNIQPFPIYIDHNLERNWHAIKNTDMGIQLLYDKLPNQDCNIQEGTEKCTNKCIQLSSNESIIKNCNDEKSQFLMERINKNIHSIPCFKTKNVDEKSIETIYKKTCFETNKINFNRVSELIRCIGDQDAMQGVEMRTDIHDVCTRQTRIAMLKMREELHDLTFHDNHHAHEYFVVNSFKLFYSLTVKSNKDVTMYRGMELPKNLLPIDIKVTNHVLDNIKKNAVFPKYIISYDDLKMNVIKDGQFEWNDVNNIYNFIKTKAEFGATLHDITTNFWYLNDKLALILLLLSEKRIVLRTGIVTVRYIHYQHINPWIIHSYKILRLEKEARQIIPEGSVYMLHNEGIIDENKETKRVTTARNLFYNSLTKANFGKNSQNAIENTDADIRFKNSNKLRQNRSVLLKQKDIYRAAKLLDFNTAEEIKVVIKPWVRIDGVLNRRVLDRMLGAVLCYCIEKPGMFLTLIQNRFTPAIQPFHTRELIEILVKLDCIKMTIQRVSKVTLFSKPTQLNLIGNPDLIADSDSIIIEPTLQATLRFGMFLSNRSYSLDFLSSL